LTIYPSPFDFKIHGNVKNEMLYHNSKEYARLSIGYDNYFYNDLTEEITQLKELLYIRPYLYENNVCYLDETLTERVEKVEFDILDSIITDYTYYKDNLYVIIRDESTVGPNGESILYNVTSRKIVKIFNSFVSFASHTLFLINEQVYRSSCPIYTLDNIGSKVIKLPFNARSINERNNKLLIYDKNYKNLKLSLEDSIYTKEK
jgi:hypothetical protein